MHEKIDVCEAFTVTMAVLKTKPERKAFLKDCVQKLGEYLKESEKNPGRDPIPELAHVSGIDPHDFAFLAFTGKETLELLLDIKKAG